jgi:hypothetical protein
VKRLPRPVDQQSKCLDREARECENKSCGYDQNDRDKNVPDTMAFSDRGEILVSIEEERRGNVSRSEEQKNCLKICQPSTLTY